MHSNLTNDTRHKHSTTCVQKKTKKRYMQCRLEAREKESRAAVAAHKEQLKQRDDEIARLAEQASVPAALAEVHTVEHFL